MFGREKRLRFDGLVRAHARDLFRLAYWLCRDRGLAEDLVQSAYARAWSHWGQAGAEAKPRAWLFGLLMAEWQLLVRRNRAADVDTRLDERLLDLESRRDGLLETRDALWSLAPRLRETLTLQVLGQYTPEELGELLGVDPADVAGVLSDARLALRRAASVQEEEQHRAA